MYLEPAQAGASPLDDVIVRLVLAAALGLFLGLEREWSEKPAGIRTFSLTTLAGAVFTLLDREALLVVGGLLVIVHGVLLALQGLRTGEGLGLTTSISLLVAYGVGALVVSGLVLEGVAVTVVSSLILVLRRELHGFAWGLTREELRATSEFAILAFVVLPVLPATETVSIGGLSLSIEPRIVWLMVVTVAGIGIVNYAVVNAYGGRGIAVAGFFGGLASSTAVVGAVLDHVSQRREAASYGVAAILLADAAMALRNLAIALLFTVPDAPLLGVIAPLGIVVLGSLGAAYLSADWGEQLAIELDSPFSLRYALGFGTLFLLVVAAGAIAEAEFGHLGLYATSAISGLVSSAGATTSAIVLYRGGVIDDTTATVAVLLATVASILVKAGFAAVAPNRRFALQVWIGSLALVVGGGIGAALTL